MCRNIKVLHNFDPAATPEEVEAAALQYVRKISGSTKPSKANEAAFMRAVDEVTAASRRLLDALVTASRRPVAPGSRRVSSCGRSGGSGAGSDNTARAGVRNLNLGLALRPRSAPPACP